ncbi:hypothetical protein ACFTTN_33670 [Streptomyces niveus]|uniref:Uncharacterized protein n=1 Tax=Streptomyces niveus TaxID=193462 RepID=A0A1U9QML1_STRNV|nr:hypothetical protein [Streptomyces niveus]AQU65518.1 hypothetical protein BBN63_03910 [Streptomyces niveus]
MTTAPTPPTVPGSGDPKPFLPVRTAIVLQTAAFVGVIAGALTYLSTGDTAGAILAGLVGLGASVPALNGLIGD